jgi:hypothetical protein
MSPAGLLSQLSLDEVLDDNARRWATLSALAESSEPTLAEFTAAGFPAEARAEAAKKLISNHVAVLKDITNPAPKTQPELPRVDRSLAQLVDLFLLETARRLLGRREHSLEASMLDRFLTVDLEQIKDERAAEAWAHAARYLNARIQVDPAHFQGRKPDMSQEGARAFLAVCNELGTLRPLPRPYTQHPAHFQGARAFLAVCNELGKLQPRDSGCYCTWGKRSLTPQNAREEEGARAFLAACNELGMPQGRTRAPTAPSPSHIHAPTGIYTLYAHHAPRDDKIIEPLSAAIPRDCLPARPHSRDLLSTAIVPFQAKRNLDFLDPPASGPLGRDASGLRIVTALQFSFAGWNGLIPPTLAAAESHTTRPRLICLPPPVFNLRRALPQVARPAGVWWTALTMNGGYCTEKLTSFPPPHPRPGEPR